MGCLRTLHHNSHLLVPRKCQRLLQEKPFCGGTKAPPCKIAIGALPLHGLHGWRKLEHEIEK